MTCVEANQLDILRDDAGGLSGPASRLSRRVHLHKRNR